MDEKKKYRAEIQARLIRFNNSLNEIKIKTAQRKENLPDIRFDETNCKREDAKAKLTGQSCQ